MRNSLSFCPHTLRRYRIDLHLRVSLCRKTPQSELLVALHNRKVAQLFSKNRTDINPEHVSDCARIPPTRECTSLRVAFFFE